MARTFTSQEWRSIMNTLKGNETSYGLPQREYGSVLLGSFNIRKLGSSSRRNQDTWNFLATICRSFDLLAVQEIMDDLSGLRKLMSLLGPEFTLIVSDQTGAFPGEPGMGERLGFIYRWSAIERREVTTDISYDRTKVLNIIAEDYDVFSEVMGAYAKKWQKYISGASGSKPKINLPIFLTFIRQPFLVSFRIAGHPGTQPYEFMAVNAHLYYGNYISDRRQEFDALMEWINGRVASDHRAYYPNFILLGDLNLDYDDPLTDRTRIEKHLKTFNNESGEAVNVYFPFLDPHPSRLQPYTTNARQSETFDQIGLFSRDMRLPNYKDNIIMGTNPRGPDYGVFEFVKLFSDAVLGKSLENLTEEEKRDFYPRFEYNVSDHMPLWIRLPLP